MPAMCAEECSKIGRYDWDPGFLLNATVDGYCQFFTAFTEWAVALLPRTARWRNGKKRTDQVPIG